MAGEPDGGGRAAPHGGAPHRVRRQRLVVRTAAGADAFAARAAVRAAWDSALLPAVERAFDRACAAAGRTDAVLRLARLEVAVRVDDVAALAGELPALVEEALVARLAGSLPAAAFPPPPTPVTAAAAGLLRAPGAPGAAAAPGAAGGAAGGAAAGPLAPGAAEAPSAARWEAVGDTWLAALLHYLRTGALPWDVRPAAAGGHADARAAVVAALRRACVEGAGAVADALEAAGAPDVARARLGALLDASSAAAVADALAARVPPAPAAATRAAVPGGAAGEVRGPDPTAADARAAVRAAAAGGDHEATAAGAPEPTPGPAAGHPPADAHDQPVPLAGLVLLHPFLPAYLRAAGADPARPADRPRAAALLHLLATTHRDVHEWELPLVKVLLGLSPDHPLPVAEGLVTDADAAEADALAAAAVGHWRALGRTSAAGLRAAFVQRAGLLGRTGGARPAWRLRVEPAGHDLLLGTLPWALSLVALPWMPGPLHVEWEAP